MTLRDDRFRMTREEKPGRRTKVGRLIDEYDLDGFGDELEKLWTTDSPERKSLRELADYFNQEILRTALDDSDIEIVSNEIEAIREQLTGETGTAADRTRLKRRLERGGVDVDSLQSDFVSYQAIRSFVKDERGAEYSSNIDPIERDKKNIQQLRNRTAVVTETKLEGLTNSGKITLGTHQVTIDVNVFCEDCGRQLDVIDVLERSGCDCGDRSS